jgi:hypothetical protein
LWESQIYRLHHGFSKRASHGGQRARTSRRTLRREDADPRRRARRGAQSVGRRLRRSRGSESPLATAIRPVTTRTCTPGASHSQRDGADPSTQTSSRWVASTGPTYRSSSSPKAIERGDHENTALYLRNDPPGNALLDLVDGGCAVITLLEMAAASGIGLFLGLVVKATITAATASWSQERTLRKAARARENAGQRDPYDRLPL